MILELSLDDYPLTLRNIPKPPKRLYMRGTLVDSAHQKYLCVIGSRLSSKYGKDVCTKLISGLKGYPISIVSGLAIGMDSHAHSVALDTDLHCIGFPGSGIVPDRIYPITRRPLAENIVACGGALVSEWLPTLDSQNWMFARRNMLMAGISHATLIIEARQGSGSLMTAKYSEDYNRDIYTVPGSIFSENSYGPHMLIKCGAVPITTSSDILQALGFVVSEGQSLISPLVQTLGRTSRDIINILSLGDSSYDDLLLEIDIDASKLNTILSELEILGLIVSHRGILRLA